MSKNSVEAKRVNKIPILMYHEITSNTINTPISEKIQYSYIVSKVDFESQIKFLSDHGYHSISLDQLLNYINSGLIHLPSKPVVITFDDGFKGNYDHAFPILKKYRMTATFFIIVNKIDQEYMLTWDQLKEMSCGGMSIQSHTMNHMLLSKVDCNGTKNELYQSKELIEDKLSKEVCFLSLPNGDYNKHYKDVALSLGYRGGCSSLFGHNDRNVDPFFLKRIAIKGNINIFHFQDLFNEKSFFIKYLRLKTSIKYGIARVISKRVYDRFYNSFYGIKG